MKLNNIALRIPCACNLDCRYCCGKLQLKNNPLTLIEIKNSIDQAVELGSKIVYIVGEGEPLLHPNIKEIIEYINHLSMTPTIYSNCTKITPKLASFFYKQNVRIIGKQNALTPDKQDEICRVSGTYNKIMQGINNLIKAGFTEDIPSRLEIHTVTLKENFKDLPILWREWRNKNILPQVQILVYPSADQPREYFDYYQHHALSPREGRLLFEQLSKIDKEEFNITWNPIHAYPIAPVNCTIHCNGIAVTQDGNIQICSYTEDPIGNIRENKLRDILESEKVRKIRNIGNNLGYPNGGYGCRAHTLNMTGDREVRDPFYDDFLKINVECENCD